LASLVYLASLEGTSVSLAYFEECFLEFDRGCFSIKIKMDKSKQDQAQLSQYNSVY
jgi:serine/threonine protein kinase